MIGALNSEEQTMQIPYRKPTKFTHIAFDPLITQAKFDELVKQLEDFKKNKRPFAASEVRRLAELGDFSENVEYQLAKGRLRWINEKILTIESQLKQANIIPTTTKNSVIQVGHTVTLVHDSIEKKYQILGSSETNPQKGIISHTSPIGAALLGRKVGDVVVIQLASKSISYTILAVD